MIESQIIESVLSTLFNFLKKNVITSPADRSKFDFIIRNDDGKKIAIEVRDQNLSLRTLSNLETAIRESNDLHAFYLITPENPHHEELAKVKSIFKGYPTEFHWFGISEYLEREGLKGGLKENYRDALLNLQVAALSTKFTPRRKTQTDSKVGQQSLMDDLKKEVKKVEQGKIDKSDIRFGLRRQFPDEIIQNLTNASSEVSKVFSFGNKYENAIIILTDIKNFSSLVSVADPGELNDLMSKYYTNTRELVFKYGGVLDKFIGDAVLAIFNYPFPNANAYKNSILFATELVLMGQGILREFQRKIDQEIQTGTRVGIASGPIYALNIGKEEIEVTFIGDKINFAARLEKNCEINGLLVSNIFYHKLDEYSHDFAVKTKAVEKKLDPNDAKGQIGVTTAWQISHVNLNDLLD